MKVEIDDKSGFCFGVVRAIEAAGQLLAEHGSGYSLGDIVHNRVEVDRLAALGLHTIGPETFAGLSAGSRVLIRAHGEPPQTYATAARSGICLTDATCPVVARLQQIVREAGEKMASANGQVVILGKRGHAEVVGLAGQLDPPPAGNSMPLSDPPGQDKAANPIIIVENAADLGQVNFSRPIYLLSQTTQSLALFGEIAGAIRARATDPSTVTIHDTICRQVSNRGPHLRDFAAEHDVIIFVSGEASSNGKVLYETCREVNPRSHKVEETADLRPEWFEGARSVGVCGATSTPRWLMETIAREIEKH